jgi:transcriptional regulator with XRE-family HTH domain
MAKPFAELRRAMPLPRKQRAIKRTNAMLAAIALADLRRGRGVTQDALAASLNVRQAAVSKLEGRDDLLLSTLAAYVRALGGTLEVVARFGDHAILLDPRAAAAKLRPAPSASRSKRGRRPATAKRMP